MYFCSSATIKLCPGRSLSHAWESTLACSLSFLKSPENKGCRWRKTPESDPSWISARINNCLFYEIRTDVSNTPTGLMLISYPGLTGGQGLRFEAATHGSAPGAAAGEALSHMTVQKDAAPVPQMIKSRLHYAPPCCDTLRSKFK